ncbi:hypothetical protein JCM11957_07130 [Caminibacter profundus]
MDKIGERIRQRRETLNISQEKLSELVGVSPKTLQRIEKGENDIKVGLLRKIADALEINFHELIGTEPINFQKTKAKSIGTVAQSMTINSQITQTGIKNNTRLEKAKEVLNNIENNHKADVVNVPFYEDIYASAGAGAYNENITPTNNLTFSTNFLKNMLNILDYTGLHIITAVGDSMQPTICDGDKLFVLPLKDYDLKDGGVYVISTPFGVLVKRVYIYPVEQKIILHSDNPEIKDEVLQGEIMEKIKFIGRVVGILRNRI